MISHSVIRRIGLVLFSCFSLCGAENQLIAETPPNIILIFGDDMGLDCVYVLSLKNGEKQAEMFGSTGDQDGQFRSPAGLIVDSSGTMIVVDSNNHRLQMVDTNYSYCGDVQVVNKSIMLTSTHTSFCFI